MSSKTRGQRLSEICFVFIFFFVFASCIQFVFSRCGAVRCSDVSRISAPTLSRLLGVHICARGAFIHVLRCPHKNAKKSEARRGIAHPPPTKKSRFRRGGRLAEPLYSPDTTII